MPLQRRRTPRICTGSLPRRCTSLIGSASASASDRRAPRSPLPGPRDRGRALNVTAIDAEWQVGEEWWRDEIHRRYIQVRLADGHRLTEFLDQLAGPWYEQRA
jgi:hypothetical protein